MDHIPTPKIDRNSAVEAAARMKDVTERAKALNVVVQGADILQAAPGSFAENCIAHSLAARDRLTNIL